MPQPKYSVRGLLLTIGLVAVLTGTFVWVQRTFRSVILVDATSEQANRALRGFTVLPDEATDIYLNYAPGLNADLKFSCPEQEARDWCKDNRWATIPLTKVNGFEIKAPRGSGAWRNGKIVLILYAG